MPNITKIGYSPNQQFLIALVLDDHKFHVFSGITYVKIGDFETIVGDSAVSFCFAPDNSFLIIGTAKGKLFSYRINDNIIDPTPGTVSQN